MCIMQTCWDLGTHCSSSLHAYVRCHFYGVIRDIHTNCLCGLLISHHAHTSHKYTRAYTHTHTHTSTHAHTLSHTHTHTHTHKHTRTYTLTHTHTQKDDVTFTGSISGDIYMWKGTILSRVISQAHSGPVFDMYTSLDDGLVLSAGKERRYCTKI